MQIKLLLLGQQRGCKNEMKAQWKSGMHMKIYIPLSLSLSLSLSLLLVIITTIVLLGGVGDFINAHVSPKVTARS